MGVITTNKHEISNILENNVVIFLREYFDKTM